MTISFACPKCGKVLAVADELAGRRGKCAGCGDTIEVPAEAELPLLEIAPSMGPTVRCASCAMQIPKAAIRCPYCRSLRLTAYAIVAFIGLVIFGLLAFVLIGICRQNSVDVSLTARAGRSRGRR